MTYAQLDGVRLWYEEQGSGPPVVLLHNGLMDSRMWDAQVAAFAPVHRVVRYDLRFYGRSDRTPTAGWSDRDDLRALLDELGIERTALVGNSHGGRIALDFTLAYPERVTGLALVASGAGNALDAYSDEHEAEGLAAEGRGDLDRVVDIDLEVWARLGETPLIRELMTANVHTNLVGEESAPVPLDPPSGERYAEVAVPTLVLTGEHDVPRMDEIAARLEREVPNVRRVRFENSDHFPSLREPERFNAVLLEFLAEVALQQSVAKS